ncbi:MAG TPA: O-antigen ligase family protein [Candidatus Acidoferrum sp.]|nr:O-antigen ligase family protein [Candidatus Acidoferrum sp.]
MANTINIPKTHLIMGLSLPLAVLIGYFLAEPLDLGSVAVVAGVLGVMSIPLLLRWYYPLLVFCWNSAISPFFLPARLTMGSLMSVIGLLLAVLTRAVNPKARFVTVPSVTRPLLVLTAIVVGTGLMTGGFGVRSLGSAHFGGGKYFQLLTGVAGYFALTSRRIPPDRVGLYMAMFFLSGLGYAMANLAVLLGPPFHFLLNFFDPEVAMQQMQAQGSLGGDIVRLNGFPASAVAGYSFLLARYGIRGLLDLKRPWRLLAFLSFCASGLYGGFRSYVGLLAITLAVLFFLEGLHRTRYLPMLLAGLLLGGVVILPHAYKLPIVAQRAITFLPGRFDPFAVANASASVDWRLEMWRLVLPDVPRYFFHGKGYAFDPGDLYLAGQSANRFQADALDPTIVAGEYHNGPLSLLIPFGIYGVIAFVWLLVAGGRTLHQNAKYGDPACQNVNRLLLATFTAHAVWFFTFFGALHSDLPMFLGLLGLGIALNGAEVVPIRAEEPQAAVEMNTEYVKA